MPDPSTSSQQDTVPQIILRIPGPWKTPGQLQAALAKTGKDFIVPTTEPGEDPYLLHQPTGQRFAIWAMDRDDEIVPLFADSGRLSSAEIRALRGHQVKVFVTGPGGSHDAARMFLAIGQAFVKAGAVGIMVDNSGNCHTPRDWLDLSGDKGMGGMYWAFVSVTVSPDEVFSAGMHCLGFRDAELPDPVDPKAAGMNMHEFLGYSYQSGIPILDGDPIGGPDGPEFILHHMECTRFPKDMPWHNPYGVWRLEKFEAENEE
jgi:hypothetical protein